MLNVYLCFSVRATSLLCLLGVGLGVGSVLLYRVYARIFGSSPYNKITESKQYKRHTAACEENNDDQKANRVSIV